MEWHKIVGRRSRLPHVWHCPPLTLKPSEVLPELRFACMNLLTNKRTRAVTFCNQQHFVLSNTGVCIRSESQPVTGRQQHGKKFETLLHEFEPEARVLRTVERFASNGLSRARKKPTMISFLQ